MDPIIPTELEQIQSEQTTVEQTKDLLLTELEHTAATEGIIGDMFSSIYQGFSSVVDRVFKLKINDTPIDQVKVDQSIDLKSSAKITGKNFVDFAQIEVQSMEGFTGSYLAYGNFLTYQLKTYFSEYLDPSLKAYEILLGSLVSSKEARSSFEDLSSKLKDSSIKKNAIEREEAKFWNPGNFNTSVKIGSVVANAAELAELKKQVDALKTNLSGISLQAVRTRIDRLSSLMGLFTQNYSEGKVDSINKQQVTNLANATQDLAEQVEMLSMLVYRSHVFLQAIERLDQRAKDLA